MEFQIPHNPELGGEGLWIQVKDRELSHATCVRLAVTADGKLAATGLVIEAELGMTARETRIPLARIVNTFASQSPATLKRLYLSRFPAGVDPQVPGEVTAARVVTTPGKTVPIVRAPRPGVRGHPDRYYRQIAKAYARAKRLHPRAPMKHLARELQTPEPTLYRALQQARKKGLLSTEEEHHDGS